MTPLEHAALAARDAMYADIQRAPAWAWDDSAMDGLRSYWLRIASAAVAAHETARQEALTAEFVEHARTVGTI